MQNEYLSALCVKISTKAEFSACVSSYCNTRAVGYLLCLCELACVAVLWFHFVLAEAGSVSAPCKLKSRFMVVVQFQACWFISRDMLLQIKH